MTSQQADLYSRLGVFSFDNKEATYTFADRLAKENGWSRAYAARAIEEYRRFLLLAATAAHPVSPLDAVDQVWHVHLLYTRSYWDDLCKHVLPAPLHHEPSTGGRAERAKFDDWYARTIESYRRTFGKAPPPDIWPAPDGKAAHPRFKRVDVARHWVMPKFGVARGLIVAVLLILLIALAGGCSRVDGSTSTATTLNPFDLRGPQFLALYAVATVVAFGLATMIWRSARGDEGASTDQLNLDAYETAYLTGGPNLAVSAAVTRLIDRNLLLADPRDGSLRSTGPAPAGLHPLELAVQRAVSPTLGTRLVSVRSSASREVDAIADRLKDRGLVVSDDRAAAARALASTVALSVPAIGTVKGFVGIARDKPIGFLVVACIVTAVAGLLIFTRRPFRTRRGEAALRRLRDTYAWVDSPRAVASGPDLTMAVALFGLGALSGTELEPLEKQLRQQGGDATNSYDGSGCGGSCGGGGGGDGGGGCGGGCGGCGGGD
jgi:uncharacterized protein (TIGR04222 family)